MSRRSQSERKGETHPLTKLCGPGAPEVSSHLREVQKRERKLYLPFFFMIYVWPSSERVPDSSSFLSLFYAPLLEQR